MDKHYWLCLNAVFAIHTLVDSLGMGRVIFEIRIFLWHPARKDKRVLLVWREALSGRRLHICWDTYCSAPATLRNGVTVTSRFVHGGERQGPSNNLHPFKSLPQPQTKQPTARNTMELLVCLASDWTGVPLEVSHQPVNGNSKFDTALQRLEEDTAGLTFHCPACNASRFCFRDSLEPRITSIVEWSGAPQLDNLCYNQGNYQSR